MTGATVGKFLGSVRSVGRASGSPASFPAGSATSLRSRRRVSGRRRGREEHRGQGGGPGPTRTRRVPSRVCPSARSSGSRGTPAAGEPSGRSTTGRGSMPWPWTRRTGRSSGSCPANTPRAGHRSRMTSASRLLPVTHPPRKPSIGRAIVPGGSADPRRWESHGPNAERAMASASPAARLPRSTAV